MPPPMLPNIRIRGNHSFLSSAEAWGHASLPALPRVDDLGAIVLSYIPRFLSHGELT
jgi:hypothetical protein